MTNQAQLFFGDLDAAAEFDKRHPLWSDRFMNLVRAIDMAFTRVQTMSEPADKLVYFYGRMCAEDFIEVLLVCGNGYGQAGLKLLRCLYEHTVTLRYLHEHPNEAGLFMNFHHVQQHKLMRNILDTFGKDAVHREVVAEVEQKYAQVKAVFRNNTWNGLDFVSMAKRAGAIGTLIVPGYFDPLRHAHTTFGGLKDRLEIVDERIQFQHEPEPAVADQALMTAHNCILNVLEVQSERFKIDGLQEQLQTCLREFVEIWMPNSDLLKDVEGA